MKLGHLLKNRKWIEPNIITLSKTSQNQKNKYGVFSHIFRSWIYLLIKDIKIGKILYGESEDWWVGRGARVANGGQMSSVTIARKISQKSLLCCLNHVH